MTLTITIDEQDISRIKPGQEAVVKFTALKGQEFEAWVSDIGMSGTNNGGSSKFTVELSLNRSKDMLVGMNAAAEIPLYTKMDTLTIPVAALVETKEGTVVYTARDAETGEPASPVAVTTGVSDGEVVEILSGLQNGDQVYYRYYDTLELDHTAKTEYSFR
jgi:HlyD family secretion protein